LARTILKSKIALIVGAEHPVGRAAALQLSRAGARPLLTGYDADALTRIADLILQKKGDAAELPLPLQPEATLATALRQARDSVGHFHFVVNALPLGGPGFDREEGRRRASVIQRHLDELSGERGFTRTLVLMHLGDPAPFEAREDRWTGIVSLADLAEDKAQVHGLRPGAAADAIVSLLQCPPSACPTAVTLRHLDTDHAD
jgi:hypothetical protein